METPRAAVQVERLALTVAGASLEGDIDVPANAGGIVLFPHGRGTERDAQDAVVAGRLRQAGFGILLLDLLTADEADLDMRKATFRFDTGLLARRLAAATDWLAEQPATHGLPVGYFGAGYGAAAALAAAAKRPGLISAVVSYDGLPSFAEYATQRVAAPTLLIGGIDQVDCERRRTDDDRLVLIPGVNHAPEEIASLATKWFTLHLQQSGPVDSRPVI